jgi:septal ring factor EnvC (AmiA/AmiB activator)
MDNQNISREASELAIQRLKQEIKQLEMETNQIRGWLVDSKHTLSEYKANIEYLRSQSPNIPRDENKSGCGTFAWVAVVIITVGFFILRFVDALPLRSIFSFSISISGNSVLVVDLLAGLILLGGIYKLWSTAADNRDQQKRYEEMDKQQRASFGLQVKTVEEQLAQYQQHLKTLRSQVPENEQKLEEKKRELAWHEANVRLK